MSGFKEETREIGGRKIRVVQLAAKQGRPLLWKLGQLGAPLLEQFGKAKNGAVEANVATSAIQMLLKGIQYSVVEEFAEAIGSKSEGTNLEGVTIKLNTVALREMFFEERYLDYFEWIAFGLEVNFRDFFSGLLDRLSTQAEASKSP